MTVEATVVTPRNFGEPQRATRHRTANSQRRQLMAVPLWRTLLCVALWVFAGVACQHFLRDALTSAPTSATFISCMQLAAGAGMQALLLAWRHPTVSRTMICARPTRVTLTAAVCFTAGTICSNAASASSSLFSVQCIKALEPAMAAAIVLISCRNAGLVHMVSA